MSSSARKGRKAAPRKVVQFSAITAGAGEHVIYVLADDGSLWLMRTHLAGDGHYFPWQRIDPLPRAKVRA